VTGPVETTLTPRGPFSLADSAGFGDLTRRMHRGVLELAYEAGGSPARARVWQRRDGSIAARVDADEQEAGIERLRFLLALDADHAPFLEMARRDPLLRDVVGRRPGMRPLRLGTVAHALLTALAGQLVTWREARGIERRIMRRVCRPHGDLLLPPTGADLGALSPAQAAAAGLAPRRAAALVRVARELDLERLHGVPTAAVAARVERERMLGPWSAGVICVYGLGRHDRGLVGDLGLIKLCRELLGRRAEAEDTARLLERYGPWQGLASVHLLGHPLARRRGGLPSAA
jgi:DNA-3-methyladenine glycosylase II